jgi:GTPase involved in cell partitioning and DNA repair
MREEFKSISRELEIMKEFVVFTKADILSLEDLERLKGDLKKEFDDFLVISVYRDEDLKLLKEELKKRLSSTPDSTI